MKITAFKKTATSKAGITFPVYTAKLTKKTGENVYARLHFNKSCEVPTNFPVVLVVEPKDANTSVSTYKTRNGKEQEQLHLWIKSYKTEDYIDPALEEFI